MLYQMGALIRRMVAAAVHSHSRGEELLSLVTLANANGTRKSKYHGTGEQHWMIARVLVLA